MSTLNMSKSTHRVLIYGGEEALGSKCVSYFKTNDWWVGSVDLMKNNAADLNILVTNTNSLPEQEEQIMKSLSSELNDTKVDAVICVAGGWTAGNSLNDFAKNTDLMWRQNVWTSVIAASIAVKYLKEGGLLTLSGAHIALKETPSMIGYGLAKAAVHHLTKSLAGNNARIPTELGSGLPPEVTCVAILPMILETPVVKDWMTKYDTALWTPLDFVVELLWKWCNNEGRPSNGSLLQLVTKNCETYVVPVENIR